MGEPDAMGCGPLIPLDADLEPEPASEILDPHRHLRRTRIAIPKRRDRR